jgi:hypothetical protein
MHYVNLMRISLAACLAVAVGSLSLLSEAAEKKEQTYVKTNFRTTSKTVVLVGDVPNHELRQEMNVSDIKYSNPDFKTKDEWAYIHADTIDGSGKANGYYFDTHDDGSTSYGSFQGTEKMTTQSDGSWVVIWEGTYQYLGGSGKFKNIKGGGKYKGKASSKEPAREEGRETVEY